LISIFTILLCCGRAQAETTGWTFTTGTVTATPSPATIHPDAASTTPGSTASTGGGGELNNSSATSITFKFTVNGTFTSSSTQTIPGPIKETISTDWGVATGNTVSIDDGFSDTTTEGLDNDYGAAGVHLSTPQGNTFSKTVTIKISFGAEPKGYTGGGFSYSVTGDTRYIVIGAGTSAKVPVTGPLAFDQYDNQQYQPGSEPAGSGDIGLPVFTDGYLDSSDVVQISYVGLLEGDWSANGSYNWADSLKGFSLSGSVTPQSPGIGVFDVTYIGDDTDSPPTGDIGKTDNITLSYTDAKDGATAKDALAMTLHPSSVAYSINGPAGPSDPNFYGYIVQGLSWPGGEPTDETQSYEVSSVAPYAAHTVIPIMANVASTTGAALTAYAPADLEVEPWGAIATLVGLTLDDIASGIPENGSISLDALWPGSSGGAYPSQWAVSGSSSGPAEYPTAPGPPDWQPGSTGPSSISESFSCVPYVVNIYENSLKGVDNWGSTGYASYQQGVHATFHVQKTIGVWTWTPTSSGGNH
jgi:hypothetical protein